MKSWMHTVSTPFAEHLLRLIALNGVRPAS